MLQYHFKNMGFMLSAEGIWEREYIHPDTGEVLRISASTRPNGATAVRYMRLGPFVREKTYRDGPAKAAQSIRQAVKKAGFRL